MDLLDAMHRADQVSRLGLGLTAPNPIVGAVILDVNGVLVGEGFHQRGDGGAHAEVKAMQQAGDRAAGATLVVTLEPCNHLGKTPPCVDAIIAAGIKRVVFAVVDPNPIASGGSHRLKSAGISIESGILKDQVSFTNRAWLTKITKQRPYLTLKIAATLDGKVAAKDGTSKWITSDQARGDVALLRSECDAIVTGTGTFLADAPKLTVRGVKRPGVTDEFNPARVVMGRRLIDTQEMIHLQSTDFSDLISLANTKGWNRILIEAGSTLTTAVMKAELFDEIFLYQAPTMLGAGADFVGDLGISTLSDRLDLDLIEAKLIEGEPNNLRSHLIARRS